MVEPVIDQGLVYDASRVPQLEACWLDAEHWRREGRVLMQARGRGQVLVVDSPIGPLALRHYRRGGHVARWLGDRYLWTGATRTRALREYRLLEQLWARGLPVPEPVAAGFQRRGPFYTADLLTRFLPGCRTLAQRLAARELDRGLAERIGAMLAEFHRHGVEHRDLNAHNVLVGENGRTWLLDFDRGRIRSVAPGWQRATIRRLRRSLSKLAAEASVGTEFATWVEAAWQKALDGERR